MALNILDLFSSQVGGQLSSAAARFLGENESATSNALSSIVPALLGSLIQKGSTESGASSILNMLNQGNYDTDIMDNLGSMFTGDDSKLNNIVNIGLPVVRNLLGDKLGGIVDWISGKNGLSNNSVSSLLSMAAPFLLGLISRKVKSDGTGVSGLMGLLSSQASSVRSALPAGLSNLVSFGDVSGPSSTSTGGYSSSNNNPNTNNDGGGMGKFLPFLLLIAGLAILWWALSRGGCNKNDVNEGVAATEQAMDTVAERVGNAMDATAEGIQDAAETVKGKLDQFGNWISDLGNEFTITLPKGQELKVFENSVERKLVDFIQKGETDETVLKNTWFTFDRLYFETGKSTLTAESKAQLDNIASILKAYPNVNIKLGGYTDNVGDDNMNMKLSADRAAAAKSDLLKRGIGAGRVEAEGYGEQHPVCAANDTDECKARNRRIDIRITKM